MGKKDDSGSLQYAMAAVSISEGDFKTAQDWFYQAAIAKPTNTDYWMQASTMMYPPEHRDFEIAEKVLLEGMINNPPSTSLFLEPLVVCGHLSHFHPHSFSVLFFFLFNFYRRYWRKSI